MWKIALMIISGIAVACGVCLTLSSREDKRSEHKGGTLSFNGRRIAKILCGFICLAGYVAVLVFLAWEPIS